MKKAIPILLLFVMLSGCDSTMFDSTIKEKNLPDEATIPTFSYYHIFGGDRSYYLVDERTGVVYLGINEKLTVMLNPDGTPVTRDQLGLDK